MGDVQPSHSASQSDVERLLLRANRAERKVRKLEAALEHVLRDPEIAHHAGWQKDARKRIAS